MENIEQLSAFYKLRGFIGRLSAGYSLLEKNCHTLLCTGVVVLISFAVVMSAAMIWFADCLQRVCILGFPFDSNVGMFSSIGSSIWLPLMICVVLLLSGISIWQSLLYGMFRKYIHLGYIPKMNISAWFEWTKRDIWRYSLYILFISCFWALILVVFYMLASLSAWFWLLLIPIWLYCGVEFALIPYFYMIERLSLWDSFLISFRKGTSAWGAAFTILLLTYLIAGVFSIIFSLPMGITVLSDYFATIGMINGEMVDLPFYYTGIKFLFGVISVLGILFSFVIVQVSMLFQFASLVALDKKKMLAEALAEEERLQAERAREIAEKEKIASYLDGSAFQPR